MGKRRKCEEVSSSRKSDSAGGTPVGVHGFLVGLGIFRRIPDDVPSCMELYEAFHEVCRHMQFRRTEEQEENQTVAQAPQQYILTS